MSQQGDFVDDTKSDFSQKLVPPKQTGRSEKQINFSSFLSKQGLVDPPRQLPKRSYSLQPDMATGWKPKKIGGSFTNNVFPLNCSCQIVDYILKQVYRKKSKQWEIAYLGPRKQNSFQLHQNKKYQNPYPITKKLQNHISQRPQIPFTPIIQQKNLKFNSNFQCGNLDAAIYITNNQYDLFMRVDTNTKGHTNWYYFSVQNGNFVGSVRFNLCNFRRQKSLYQRGLKPYYYSKKSSDIWKQGGQNIRYQRRPLRYKFLQIHSLKTYITLTFTYHFDIPNDTVQFAYFIPYSYSRLLKFIEPLKNVKHLPPLKSLSGLNIPILEISDNQDKEEHNKKVVVLAGRIHPGESNSSFVCEGFLEYACSENAEAKQYRKRFVTYVVPMINPDGVVAGNYRTSLFGKDLNRTYNSTRRFAFPQTFHLLQLIKDLKSKHKQKLNIFIDLHGHSVKKNIFMYGPQFHIHHPNYYISKQLPKILSSICPYFRFYSCIFKISSQKSTTARATLNRYLNIPFTYTMESSNGFYWDSQLKKQFQLNSKKLKKMGEALCDALVKFKEVEENRTMYNGNGSGLGNGNAKGRMNENNNNEGKNKQQMIQKLQEQIDQQAMKTKSLKKVDLFSLTEGHQPLNFSEPALTKPFPSTQLFNQNLPYQSPLKQYPAYQTQPHEILSDDNISQGNSDSQPSDQDLSDQQLDKILQTIQKGRQPQTISPTKHSTPSSNQIIPTIFQTDNIFKYTKFSQRQIKNKNRYNKKRSPIFPPINCLNRAQAKQTNKANTNTNTNKTFLDTPSSVGLVNIRNFSPQKQKRTKHLSISQMIQDARSDIGSIRKQQIVIGPSSGLKKKGSKFQLEHNNSHKIKFFVNNSSLASMNSNNNNQKY